MKMDEIKKLDRQGLETKLAEFRQELFQLRFRHATAQLEKTHRLNEVRKTIARILTAMNQGRVGA